MTDKNLTPDELALHLSEIAKEHGAALTEIEFVTCTGTAVGTHNYSAVKTFTVDSALPQTTFTAQACG